MPFLKFAGRWGAELSLELYVQEAMSYLNTRALDAQVLARVRHIVQASAPFWARPPAKGWQLYFPRASQWQFPPRRRLTAQRTS